MGDDDDEDDFQASLTKKEKAKALIFVAGSFGDHAATSSISSLECAAFFQVNLCLSSCIPHLDSIMGTTTEKKRPFLTIHPGIYCTFCCHVF